MNRRTATFSLIPLIAFPGLAFGANKAAEQAEVRKAAQDALNALCRAQPAARKQVESAAGYAAFSNFGMKILLARRGKGKASPSTARPRPWSI